MICLLLLRYADAIAIFAMFVSLHCSFAAAAIAVIASHISIFAEFSDLDTRRLPVAIANTLVHYAMIAIMISHIFFSMLFAAFIICRYACFFSLVCRRHYLIFRRHALPRCQSACFTLP